MITYDPRNQCFGKIQYMSKKIAKEVSGRTKRKLNGDTMCVYKCPHCGGWHVGHKPHKKS